MSRLSNIAATAALFLAVLVVGGVHSATAIVVCALASIAVAAQLVQLYKRTDRYVNISLFGLGFALLSLVSVIQIIPVPDWVHGVFNPVGLSWTTAGLKASGLTMADMRPLSLDPALTADRAVRFAACTLMAIWAANVRSHKLPWSVSKCVMALGLTTLLTGFVLSAAGMHSFFGLFPTQVGFRRPSTFVSLNHGAIFFGFVALVAAMDAARLRALGESIAAPVLLGVVFLAVALIHDSDGVNLALLLCAGLGGAVAWVRGGRPMPTRQLAIGVGLITAMTLVAAAWLDIYSVIFDAGLLRGEHGARLEVMRGSVAALGDFWRLGAGGGGLETVISSYVDHAAVGAVSIPVVENETLELLVGYGIVVGGAAIALFVTQVALLARRAFSPTRSVRQAGALVVAVFFGLVAQLHFPLLPLGIVLPIVVWLELAWSRRRREPRERILQRSGHVTCSFGAAAAVAAVLFVGAAGASITGQVWGRPSLPTDDEGAARFVWLRPADARLYARLATRAARAGETERASALAEYAVVREPSARMELFRARALAAHSEAASAAVYARLLGAPNAIKRYVPAFLADVRSVEDRVDALAPHTPLWGPVVTEVYAREGADAASSLVIALTTEFGGRPEPYRIAAELYLQMNRPVLARLWAEQLAEREERADVDVIESPLHLARALHAAGKTGEARALLDELIDQQPMPEAHRLALVIDAEAEGITGVTSTKRHHAALCVSPLPNRDRRLCWETEARLAEHDEDFATARRVFHRVWKREGDPRPLARFHARRGECDAARAVASKLPEGRRRTQVEAIARKCLNRP